MIIVIIVIIVLIIIVILVILVIMGNEDYHRGDESFAPLAKFIILNTKSIILNAKSSTVKPHL